MNALVKFLTDKIGYTVLIILGFLFPGILFVFVWNRDLYLEMELIKLILLALSISFMIFMANFVFTTVNSAMQYAIGRDKDDLHTILGFPIFVSDIEISAAMLYKLYNPEFTIIEFLRIVVLFQGVIVLVGVVPSIVIWLFQKAKNKFKRK